jgi:5'-nucleotidase
MIAVSVGVVVGAPLAVTSVTAPAGATTITGAQALTDKVSVTYKKPKTYGTTDVHLLAWNDFHGNLDPGTLNIYGKYAGGAAYLAKAVKDLQAKYGKNVATVTAGDNIGAAPLVNALFDQEPAEIISDLMHVDYMSVGNHEFDKGYQDLLRMERGGCGASDCNAAPYTVENPDGTISTKQYYPGTNWQYLSANVVRNDTGKTLFPAYGTKTYWPADDGKAFKVGFIGEVLQSTPTIVTPTGVAGLTFQDEATAANKAVADMKKKGVKIPILVIHQGGFQTTTQTSTNNCAGSLAGSDIEAIAKKLDPSIKVIVSGHTHAEYRCTITTTASDGSTVTRLITSAASYGRILSDLTLTVDDKTGELAAASATNNVVVNATNADTKTARVSDPTKQDPTVEKVVEQYDTAVAPLANQVIGKIQGNLTRDASPVGETTMGDVIADAQLAATSGASSGAAKIAFMNPGGVRSDMLTTDNTGGQQPGEVTYNEAFTVQPFGNTMVVKTMTGAQIRALLQQQYVGCGGQTTQRILQISTGFGWTANPSAATCDGKVGAITLNGTAISDTDTFRVAMNNFLATGGDGFTVFNQGTDSLGGAVDIDALVTYFKAAGDTGIAVPTLNRIIAGS